MSFPSQYDPSPLASFVRIVTRSFRIGSAFGVEVRMYWATLLLPLLFLVWTLPYASSTGTALVRVAILFFGLFAVIWTHEMGHIAMGWRHHVRTNLITLGPLGGVAHMNAPATSPAAELQITLAGPAVHLIWLAIFWPMAWFGLDDWSYGSLGFAVSYLVSLNLALLVFNLLPVFPLDGGRASRALLAMRVHPNRATMWVTAAGIVGGALMVVLAIRRPQFEGVIGMSIGLMCISRCLEERRMARHVLVYQESMRSDPWESDPDAWKRGVVDPVHASERPARVSAFSRWRARRAEQRRERDRLAQRELDRRVDEVLARVHEVGMNRLSEEEKAVLKRASQQRRGAG